MRVRNGEGCTGASSLLRMMDEDEFRETSIAAFNECALHAVRDLDDRVSPANVVAEAAFGSCRGKLTPGLASSTAFSSRLLPSMTAAVLRNRQAKPAAPQPAPAAPKAQQK